MARIGPGHNLTPRGAWTASTLYHVDDLYTQGGNAYRVTTQYTSGVSFGATDTTNTEVFAAAGTAGSAGAAGAAGSPGAGGMKQNKAGVLTVSTGTERWYNDTGHTMSMLKARASVGVVPTGTVSVDFKKNGTSIFTDGPITIPVGNASASKVPNAGGTCGVSQKTTNGVFTTAPSAASVLVLFSTSPTLPTGIGTWTLLGTASNTASHLSVFVCLNPDGASTTIATNTGFIALEVGGTTKVATFVAGGTGNSATTASDAPTVGAGGIFLSGLNQGDHGYTWTVTAGTSDLSVGGAAAGHAVSAAGGAATVSYAGTVGSVAHAGVTFAAKAATINDGDYITTDVTAADGTAADLVTELTTA